MDPSTVIGIDLGGTKAAGALFDRQGRLLRQEQRSLEGRAGKAVGRLITGLIRQLIDEARQRDRTVTAVGVGVPGIYYRERGAVWAPNIPGWEDFPLRDHLAAALESEVLTIRIDSDRACYILGEAWRGVAAGCRDAIFLAVGTGIGAGILVDGHVLRGAADIGGAVGWMMLGESKIPHDPGTGHFESHASGSGIAHVARYLMSGGEAPSAEAVFEAYRRGDPQARAVLRLAVQYWGRAVANLVSIFNPEKVIFGGGVFGPAVALLDEIGAEARKWGQPISMRQVRLEPSRLGGEAGLYGAGYLAWQE